ncbi:MAG: hypothetical protein U5R06_20140 [candidate division KSB1 bacterium]|nr:hypothetical protein [candidate division KSB1 bacterium]
MNLLSMPRLNSKVTAPHQFIYQDSPAEYAMPGDAFSGILMVENAGQNTIYSSTLVFDYPVFLKLSTDTDFEYQDSDSLDTARRSWDLPEMASGASLWIQFSAQVPDTMRAAIVPVHFLGRIEAAHDVDITNNRAERDQNIYAISPQFDPPTDLKIELNALTDDRIMAPAAPVTRIAPGDSFEYQINVSNLGPSDADTFDVALNLPPSIHILSFDVPDSVIRLSKGVWRYPGLVPTSTLESLIRVQVDDTVTVESLNAMAKVGYSADVDTSNNTDSARVFITPPPKTADLSMHIDLDVDTSLIVDDEIIPAVVYPDSLMYRLMVHNAGPDTALNIVLSHTLPPEMQFLSSERGPETLDETDFNWTIGEIPPNDSLSILITIQPDEMSVFPVVLEMSALAQADRDTLPDNNVMIQDFAVLESRPAEMKTADLSTHMEFDTDTSFVVDDQTIPAVVYPDSLNYRLMVYNAGPDTAVDCMIIHSLPPEMQFVYADAEPEISNAGTLSWEVPGIAPGDSHAIAMIIKPGDIDDYPLQLEMSILAKADRDTLLQNNQLARSFAILEPQKPDDMLSDLNLDILMNPDTVYRKDGTDYPAFFYPDSVDYHLHIVNHGPDTAGLFDLTHRFRVYLKQLNRPGLFRILSIIEHLPNCLPAILS